MGDRTPKPPKVECKVRGFTLNVRGAKELNFNSKKDTVVKALKGSSSGECIKVVNPSFFNRDVTAKRIKLTVCEKKYNLVFDKCVVDPATAIHYPFGYEHNLEMLLELLSGGEVCMVAPPSTHNS